jgi:hypothetical protein
MEKQNTWPHTFFATILLKTKAKNTTYDYGMKD